MSTEKTIFSQLLSFVPRHEFDKCVARYDGDYRVRSFTCWEQFIVMCFAQLTYRESLYNVPACQDTKLKNLSYILLPFLSAYAAIRYC